MPLKGLTVACLTAASLSVLALSSAWAGPSNDFDGDGVSDNLSTTSTTTSINWKSVPSTTGGRSINTEFGRTDDLPIPGYWRSSLTPSLAVVTTDLSAKRLTWRTLLNDGTLVKRSLGSPGDVVLSGGDFDGDGVADAATVKIAGNRFRWSIGTEFLADTTAKIRNFTFGNVGQRVFFVNVDGSKDLAAVFGLARGRRSAELLVKDVASRKQERFGKFPRRLAGGQRPRPIPVQREDGSDVLAFVTTDTTDTTVEVYDVAGQLLDKATLPGLGPVYVGDYDRNLPGEEIGLQSNNTLRLMNPFAKTRNDAGTLTGTAQDQIAIAQTVAPTPLPTVAPTETPVE